MEGQCRRIPPAVLSTINGERGALGLLPVALGARKHPSCLGIWDPFVIQGL